jgi:hypothetical protein
VIAAGIPLTVIVLDAVPASRNPFIIRTSPDASA